MPDELAVDPASALDDYGPSILTTPDIPPEIAAALEGGLRTGLCTLAIARAIERGDALDPWLARGLVGRFLEGVRAHLRLLGALVPEATVPEGVLPSNERLDMQVIAERHRRARTRAAATFETARRRLEGDA